ncbi:ChaN family lipoprotein [Leucothrix arctica]|uniref:Haem-binding uptake Tiki superfamily ChaN domain-containing protein n=1 Tax=Leucothrix arctica TaxID=1481894 RepID=A0A317CHE8_9GAMM|nr:ChaN family lipoprotein [Leucothrix arctica]PWQ97789.1 hypothetical protein DKT75_05865 [Leucothrix arctica]
MMIKRLAILSSLLLLLNGCALNTRSGETPSPATTNLTTAYDYQLLSPNYHPISLSKIVSAASKADVVFIGEYHGNHASHILQMQLLEKLHNAKKQQRRPIILSMEQFERNQQTILNDYLSNKIGEQYFIDKTPAWSNYKASYRPLVEYAKQNDISIVAANAPADIVRCIGRVGESYINKLSSDKKQTITNKPFAEIPRYANKFFGVMGLSGHAVAGKRMQQSYLAQLTRDNTMAESINKALKQSPNIQVVHLNGSFHSAEHLGTVGALKRMNPTLKVLIITPIHKEQFAEHKKKHKNTDDYHYLLNSQPKAFVNPENMKAAHTAMFAKSAAKSKLCE